MNSKDTARLSGVAILIFAAVIMAASGTYVVQPGYRGVEVTMGKVSPAFKPEGFGLKAPFVTTMFESLVAPRVHEALKEVTALQSAEQIVKNREQIKTRALEIARKKIGTLLVVEDIVIQNIDLTKELEHAIEAKMVQEQEASKSKYLQQRAQIEADTAVIQAKGEAESIRIRGQALKDNPAFVDLKIVDKWDGITPLVIGGGESLLLPLSDLEHRQSKDNAPAQPATRRSLSPR